MTDNAEDLPDMEEVHRQLVWLFLRDHPRGDPAREGFNEEVAQFIHQCRDGLAKAKAEAEALVLAEDRSKIIKPRTRHDAPVVPTPDLREKAERDRLLRADVLRRFEASLSENALRRLRKIRVSVDQFARILERTA